jgi:hypothetical protein
MRHRERQRERKVLWFRPQKGIQQAARCNLRATDGFLLPHRSEIAVKGELGFKLFQCTVAACWDFWETHRHVFEVLLSLEVYLVAG